MGSGSIIHDQQKEIEKFEMFYLDRNKQDFQGGEVTGLAYGDFFAVWSKGRSIQEVMGSCLHEYAHNEFNMIHPYDCQKCEKVV